MSGTWTHVYSDIDEEWVGDHSEESISLSSNGSTVAIGVPYNKGNGSLSRHVRIYNYISGTGTQIDPDIGGEA